MRAARCLSAVITLLLLSGYTLARGDEKVLVAGEVPLTQETVDLYQEMWQWYCDVKLTPEERQKFTQLFINVWKKSPPPVTKSLLAGYGRMEKEWRGILELKGAEQARKRAEVRDRWMTILRNATNDPPGRLLVSVYDDAYRSGGTKNPILVKVDPPLTQSMVNLDMAVTEMLLDFQLTDKQREEYQRLFVELWKTCDQLERRRRTGNLETWTKLPTLNNYTRNEKRTMMQAKLLAVWAKNPTDLSRWLTTLYESACKPGSERNPVLVDDKPQLTQLVVDRYIDYLEIVLDLSVSGGFTPAQRQVLQDYLVKDWKTMDATVKDEMFTDMTRWSEAARNGVAVAVEHIGAVRPKLLGQLSIARDDARSKWLLEVTAQERKLAEQQSEAERKRHEATMKLLDNLRPSGSWRFNGVTGRLEWVP
jgi:hypothetical protein